LGLNARYARKVELFPERYSRNGFGPIRSVREFDDAITAPQFGYRDAQEYYEAAGAKRLVDKVRRAATANYGSERSVRAVRSDSRQCAEKNPAIELVATKHGGHCGFISNENGSGRFWAEQGAWWSFAPGLSDGELYRSAVMASLPAADRRSEESLFLFD